MMTKNTLILLGLALLLVACQKKDQDIIIYPTNNDNKVIVDPIVDVFPSLEGTWQLTSYQLSNGNATAETFYPNEVLEVSFKADGTFSHHDFEDCEDLTYVQFLGTKQIEYSITCPSSVPMQYRIFYLLTDEDHLSLRPLCAEFCSYNYERVE
ncbi:MAG: hypothetical protein AAFP19_03235 [Bacteroidota bacterium]